MKEIMLPYILVVWLLFKFDVTQTNPKELLRVCCDWFTITHKFVCRTSFLFAD